MTATEIAKYVFREERVDWELHVLKNRSRELVQARQRAMYMIHYFHPYLTCKVVGKIFGKDHATVLHAYKKVTDYIAWCKNDEKAISKYITNIRLMTDLNLRARKINGYKVIYKFDNRRVAVRKYSLGYEIELKRLIDGKIEEKTITVSDEAYNAIIQGYRELNGIM